MGGHAVTNASWTFTETTTYYQFTTTSVIAAGGVLSLGMIGTLTPGTAQGAVTFSTTILPGSGGEIRTDNNNDAQGNRFKIDGKI